MSDEYIWLLLFGTGWVDLWELVEKYNPVFVRLSEADKLEMDENLERVRLKEKE